MKKENKIKVANLLKKLGGEIPESFYIGPKGEKGDKGDKGDPGESIIGPQGPVGEQGPIGKDGKDGTDGKDAVSPDLKVLNEDLQKLRDRFNSIGMGGGNANRNIVVEGQTVLTPYTDINFVGTTSSITALTDTMARQTKIIIPTGGGGAGNPSAPDKSIQFNDGGSFGGDADLTWNKVSNVLSLTDGGSIGSSGSLDVFSGDFENVRLSAGETGRVMLIGGNGVGVEGGGEVDADGGNAGTDGVGGHLVFNGGLGGTATGDGGTVFFTAGGARGGDGNGGAVEFVGGAGNGNGNGGDIIIQPGDDPGGSGRRGQVIFPTDNGTYGGIDFVIKDQTTANVDGNYFDLFTGKGNGTGNGGDIVLSPGAGGATSGSGGRINISSGAAGGSIDSGGNGGDLVFSAGVQQNATGGNGGSFTMQGGDAIRGNGGGFTLTAGSSTNGDAGNGGSFTLSAGNSSGVGNGGDIRLNLGGGTGGGVNGKFYVAKGSGLRGYLDFESLSSSDKTFTFPNVSGTVAVLGSVNPANDFKLTGDIEILGDVTNRNMFVDDPTVNNSDGTNFLFTGSNGLGGANGGKLKFIAGDSGLTSGSGADVVFESGQGKGTASPAGNILFTLQGGNGAADGKLKVEPKAGGIYGILDFDSLATSDKIFTFLNATGNIPTVSGHDRSTAQTAAKSLTAVTVGGADASYLVSANVSITTSTAFSFGATCTYTDETNTSRTLTLSFSNVAGTFLNTITNVLGAGAYEGIPLHIRAKAGTTITIASVGTFTTVTYNLEGLITQCN